MAALAFVALVLAMTGGSEAAWCVCKPEMADVALQKTLDYACGAGADCIPIHQNGACWNPNTVRAHCSYAANGYFQRKGQAQEACDFSGTATLTTTDPMVAPTPQLPGTSSTSTRSTPGTTASSITPTNGALGGLGPSSDISTDIDHGGFLLKAGMSSLIVVCSVMAWFG